MGGVTIRRRGGEGDWSASEEGTHLEREGEEKPKTATVKLHKIDSEITW